MLKTTLAKIRVRLSEQVFTICTRFEWPTVAAILFYLTLREIGNGGRREKGGDRHRYRILTLDRVVFTEDVLASLGSSSEFKVVKPSNNSIKGLAHGILPSYLDDNFYLTEDAHAIASKKRYREFLNAMWRKLERYVKFDAVVTGNFGYYAEQELAGVLEEMGTPFIAMHKENLKSPGRIEFSRTIYRDRRGPFGGRRILVYNEGERLLQIDARVASPEKITVCGMPRLDRVHEWRRSNSGKQHSVDRRPQVLFFSFTPKAVLPRIGRRPQAGFEGNAESIEAPLEKLSWEVLSRHSHQAVLKLAKENPQIDVVIKSKVRLRERSEMHRMIGEDGKLPDNLRIVVGGDPLDLIKERDVVCGFNTTGLLEALATGKPVVVPRFAEAVDPKMQPYIVDLEDTAEYAGSPAELVALLRQNALSRRPIPMNLDSAQQRVLERWVGNSDGRAGERVRAAVVDEIKSSVEAHLSSVHG
jgi:hypothetical protein